MAQTPPPQFVLAQPRAQKAVEAQPTTQPEAQPAQAQAPAMLHQSVETQPAKPAPAVQARPTAQQVPQVRPATLSTGRYVKQDLNFVKEVLSADTGEAFRLIRQSFEKKLGRKFVQEA
jgi:pyruvate/2-oxoglutarate dehydrogenase complex dihydrolipoamide acyltransferase (E2) component